MRALISSSSRASPMLSPLSSSSSPEAICGTSRVRRKFDPEISTPWPAKKNAATSPGSIWLRNRCQSRLNSNRREILAAQDVESERREGVADGLGVVDRLAELPIGLEVVVSVDADDDRDPLFRACRRRRHAAEQKQAEKNR